MTLRTPIQESPWYLPCTFTSTLNIWFDSLEGRSSVWDCLAIWFNMSPSLDPKARLVILFFVLFVYLNLGLNNVGPLNLFYSQRPNFSCTPQFLLFIYFLLTYLVIFVEFIFNSVTIKKYKKNSKYQKNKIIKDKVKK